MSIPNSPKIYHILHVDRISSIIANGCLWSDSEATRRRVPGTTIGMDTIKQRRRTRRLDSYPDLCVGDCVPFYFCPRSVMLYVIHMADNPELKYREGQAPIVHLEADLHEVVSWAERNGHRWAFTLSNAGANYFEDYADLAFLDSIDWSAVQADWWSGSGISESVERNKQAEFLIECYFPWELVSRIGVRSQNVCEQVKELIQESSHRPCVEVRPDWYYDNVPAKIGRAQSPVDPLLVCDPPPGADTNNYSIGGRITKIFPLRREWGDTIVTSGQLEHTQHTPAAMSQHGSTRPPVTVHWKAGDEAAYILDVVGQGSYVILHGRMTAHKWKNRVLDRLHVERLEVLRAADATAWVEYQAEVEGDSEACSGTDETVDA